MAPFFPRARNTYRTGFIWNRIPSSSDRSVIDTVVVHSDTVTKVGGSSTYLRFTADTVVVHTDSVAKELGPAYIGHGTVAASSSNGATLNPSLPAGWAIGDGLVLQLTVRGLAPQSVTAGWTLRKQQGSLWLYSRVAQSGDTAPTIIKGADTNWTQAVVHAVRRVRQEDPFAVIGTGISAIASSTATPAITPGVSSTLVLHFVGKAGDRANATTVAWSAVDPTTLIERLDDTSGGSGGVGIHAASETKVSGASSTGTLVTTFSNTGVSYDAVAVAFLSEITTKVRALSDTVVTHTDSIARTFPLVRNLSDTAVTHTDSIAFVHTGTSSFDTVVTHSESIQRALTRRVEDGVTTFSDSVIRGFHFPRAISDTAVTHSDTVQPSKPRFLTDTVVTHTDSIFIRVPAKNLFDTVVTHTESLRRNVGRTGLTDSVVTASDQINRGFPRSLSDTAVTHTDFAAATALTRIIRDASDSFDFFDGIAITVARTPGTPQYPPWMGGVVVTRDPITVPVAIRHIKREAGYGSRLLLEKEFAPSWDGLNRGHFGMQAGEYELRLYEEGRFTIRMPNAIGDDGLLHRERFKVFSRVDEYRPGDEWIEIWREQDLLFVGTPLRGKITRGTLEVSGFDPYWTLRKERETWAGYWTHAPRDVFEHYTSVWIAPLSDDFDNASTYVYGTGFQTTADARWRYSRVEPGPTGSSLRMRPGAAKTYATIHGAHTKAFPIGYGHTEQFSFWRVEGTFSRPRFGSEGVKPFGDNAHVRIGVRDTNGVPLAYVQLQEKYTYAAMVLAETTLTSNINATTLTIPVVATAAFPNVPFDVRIDDEWIRIEGTTGTSLLADRRGMRGTRAVAHSSGDFVIAGMRDDVGMQTDAPGPYHVVVEGRGRWIYFYVNQRLVRVLPMMRGPVNVVPFASCRTGTTTSWQFADLQNLMIRRSRPYLLTGANKGDYHLPGAPTPGGLFGAYYNDSDIEGSSSDPLSKKSIQEYRQQVFQPRKEPYHTRIDKEIAFTVQKPAAWMPAGPVGGKWWSARWMGSIYLELSQRDYRLRYKTANEGGRLWLGKTRWTEQLMDNWLVEGDDPEAGVVQDNDITVTSKSVRTHLGLNAEGVYVDGWYPILIEFANGGTSSAKMLLYYERADQPNVWRIVPEKYLSPYGIFNEHIRLESHYEMIRSLGESFGYQYTCEPHQLESPSFPGVLIPRVRVGRDTEKQLTALEAVDYDVDINAEEVADTFLADAAGIADPEQANQLTAENIRYDTLEDRLFVQQEYGSLAEIEHRPLLEQRMDSMMALMSSPWESVSAQPPGFRELLDAFPMAGDLAEFHWEPGDGVRIFLPELGVIDASPRQILGVQRTFVPDGVREPTVAFRQRPRSFRETIRKIQRTALSQIRNYQGQFVKVAGNLAYGGSLADYEGALVSRVSLPIDLSAISKAEVVVMRKSDATRWYIHVNGRATDVTINSVGRYDITSFIARANSRDPVMRVSVKQDIGNELGRVTVDAGSPGQGGVEYVAELTLRI